MVNCGTNVPVVRLASGYLGSFDLRPAGKPAFGTIRTPRGPNEYFRAQFFRRKAVPLTPERWLLQVQPADAAILHAGSVRTFLAPSALETVSARQQASLPRQRHFPLQLSKPRIGADGIEHEVRLQTHQTFIVFLERGVEPLKSLIFVARSAYASAIL